MENTSKSKTKSPLDPDLSMGFVDCLAQAHLAAVVLFVVLPLALVLNGSFIPAFVVVNGGRKVPVAPKEEGEGEKNEQSWC